MSKVRTITKNLAGVEDLLLGKGTVQQARSKGTYQINKLRVPTVVESLTELNELDPEQFPEAILVEDGEATTYSYDGTNWTITDFRTKVHTGKPLIEQLDNTRLRTGDVVITTGYHTTGDGGNAIYTVVPKLTGSADGGTYINILSGARQLQLTYTGIVNPKLFGAVGDGSIDDTIAIQNAFNAVPDGGSIWFPKTGLGNGPQYYITAEITVSSNDISIMSGAKAEFSNGLVTDKPITMLKVTGYGVRFQNFGLKGQGTTETFGETNGINIDRTSLGDAETYSNLDCEIHDCNFAYLKDAITGKGRNVFIFDCLFSVCKKGIVGLLHTYSGGTVSQFRGWRIGRNRFHSLGNPYVNSLGTELYPASMEAWDSICIEMPKTSSFTRHLEIVGNNVDFCGAIFYKGYLAGAKITDNFIFQNMPVCIHAVITDTDNINLSNSHFGVIKNNIFDQRVISSSVSGYTSNNNTIKVHNVNYLELKHNTFRNSYLDLLNIDGCVRIDIEGNKLINGNRAFDDDATKRPAVTLINSPFARFVDNRVMSQAGAVYSNGLATSAVSNLTIKDNTISEADVLYGVAATDLISAVDEGLPWQSPTLSNGFTLVSGRGYRRTFDGQVNLELVVANGTDNTTVFTLPEGYRPPNNITIPQIGTWEHAYALISSSGTVTINWQGTPASNYALNLKFTV